MSIEVEETLTSYLEEQFRNQGDEIDLAADDDLVELGLDSIAYVRLVAFIKQEFGISVPDRDLTLDRFGTIGRMVGYLAERHA